MTPERAPIPGPASGPGHRHFVSVGTKLTGAVLLVLSFVTVLAYFEVSRNEREQVLSAKEHAATMVTELFAAGVTAPLSFSDDVGVREHVALLMANTAVVYAAVWRADGALPGEKVAETARGVPPPEPPPLIPPVPEVERTAQVVAVRHAVTSASGEVLGVVLVEFSLVRENAAIAAAQRRTLATSLATGLGLAGVLLALSRTLVVRRLAKLAKAAKHLGQGDVVDVDFDTNDEVGALSRAFTTMSAAIASREAQISSRNRDLRRVLDNVAEGLMTVKKDGTISDERSRSIDEWFGAPAHRSQVCDYFETFAPAMGRLLRLAWMSLQDDLMPVEVIFDQISRRFEHQARSYELDYSPIWSGSEADQVLDEVLVVVRDVTARVERERVEQSQRDALNVFRRILVDPAGFRDFLLRASRLVDAIEQGQASGATRSSVMRDIHTLKGDTGLYGIESVAAVCHRIESRTQEQDDAPTVEEIALLRAAWNHVRSLAAELESGSGDRRVEIHAHEHQRLLAELEARGCDEEVVLTVRSWTHELADRCLQRVAEQGRSLARRLGKTNASIDVRVTPSSLRLPAAHWAPVWSVYSHVLRNTFDHGVEAAEERVAVHKPTLAKVEILLEATRQGVELRIVDDGRGIDWEKIRERAGELGLPHATESDLEEALFVDKVTTRTSATEISGRGLGMGAVRDVVRKCGGRMSVESVYGAGTTVVCHFPPAMIEWPRRSALSSKAPAASKVA
ncbi:MAG TPA: ATP-binding protein [Polyangiaceae bacterium]